MHAPSLYATVTQSIIEELEQGTVPWVKPWKGGLGAGGTGCMPHNAVTGRGYSGVNVLTLWAAAVRKGYPLPQWLTFNQAREAGGHVRKGEKGTAIVFAKQIDIDDETGKGEEAKRRIPVLRTFTVFNVAQVEGLPDELYAAPQGRPEGERHAAAAAFVAATGAEIRHGGDRAAYLPGPDVIAMPPTEAFESAEHYCATEFHELGHWSGHAHRLARDFTGRFGSRAYAAEELVAELTAAFLCAELGIEGRLRHADYIGHWLELLENDHRAIFTAASKASQAAEYLKSFSAPPEAD
jgi:antirestriction protein ArdC